MAFQVARKLFSEQGYLFRNISRNTKSYILKTTSHDVQRGISGLIKQESTWIKTAGKKTENSSQDNGIGKLPIYSMSRRPRGWCIIINNKYFCGDSDPRHGTDADASRLKDVFKSLDFSVKREDNLTYRHMKQFIDEYSLGMDHDNFDCFVCCILTHGNQEGLFGTDKKAISIRDLTAPFEADRCPTLAGKPKLFFLQACQGEKKMTGALANGDRKLLNGFSRQNASACEAVDDIRTIPNGADFLIGYATLAGHVAWRNPEQGSWYIRKLCENLKKLHKSEDLLSILTQVNKEVSELEYEDYKQIPAPHYTLRKKLYFL